MEGLFKLTQCRPKRWRIADCMRRSTYARHRFPPQIIQHAVWLYCRFILGLRDVEDLLAERGVDVDYETIRRLTFKFGRLYAKRIRRRRFESSRRWHLDEAFIRIGGRILYLWRAVDDEGEVVDILVQSKRSRKASLKLMCRIPWRRSAPTAIVTDRMRSYGAALSDLGLVNRHVLGGRSNNRAEVSHQLSRQRERQRRRFPTPGSAQQSPRSTPPSTTSSTSSAI